MATMYSAKVGKQKFFLMKALLRTTNPKLAMQTPKKKTQTNIIVIFVMKRKRKCDNHLAHLKKKKCVNETKFNKSMK